MAFLHLFFSELAGSSLSTVPGVVCVCCGVGLGARGGVRADGKTYLCISLGFLLFQLVKSVCVPIAIIIRNVVG